MATQTAIEYAGRRVRLLEFDGTQRKLRVVGIEEVNLDVPPQEEGGPDPDDLRAKAIAAAMKEAGFATDPSAMAFDAGHAMFREFDLPFTNEEQIAKVVRFESESHFPGDIDDVIIQHVVLRKLRDKSHLLVAAVRKDDLLDRLDILEESGLDPQFVDIDVFAVYHALIGTGLAAEHARMIVVDAETSTTTLMFLVDGTLFAVRSIRIGTHGVATAAAEAPDPDTVPASGGAAAAVARGAERESELETARTHDYLTRLTREIRRTLSTLPDFGQADALYVMGSGSRLPGIRESMSAAFGVRATALNLLDRVDHKLSDADVERYGPECGAALGMAYKLSGLDRTRTDFRREEAAYTRKFDQVKTPLIVLALMTFLVTAFLGLHAFMDVKRLKAEYGDPATFSGILGTGDRQLTELFDSEEQLAEARARIAAAEFGPRRVQALVNEVQKLSDDIEKGLGRSSTIPELRSALGAWIELFDVIRQNESTLGRLAITRVDIEAAGKEPTIKISGEMEDLTHLSAFMDLLKARPMFTDTSVGQTKPTTKGTMSFTDLTVQLDLSGGSDADAEGMD